MDLLPLPSDSTEDACYTTMSNSSSELGKVKVLLQTQSIISASSRTEEWEVV